MSSVVGEAGRYWRIDMTGVKDGSVRDLLAEPQRAHCECFLTCSHRQLHRHYALAAVLSAAVFAAIYIG